MKLPDAYSPTIELTTQDGATVVCDTSAVYNALASQMREVFERRAALDKPSSASNYLILHCQSLAAENFGVIFLDSQNRVIGHKVLFTGTINQTAVFPREVVIAALQAQSAAVILWHNHPSGVSAPSSADISLTSTLKMALSTVGIGVLDHLVIGASCHYSFAEAGRI